MIYTASRASSALSTTNDTVTIICGASKTIRIKRIVFGSMGTASAANEIFISRSTGGTTGGGAITPTPHAAEQPASGCTVYTTWSAQPTLNVTILRATLNANGAVWVWVATPGEEIILRNSEQLSIRSVSGTSSVVVDVTWEE